MSFAGHSAATSPWLAEQLVGAFAVALAVEQRQSVPAEVEYLPSDYSASSFGGCS